MHLPRGNRAFLLAALLFLWAAGASFTLAWHVAFSAFDGTEAHIVLAALLFYGGGLVITGCIYAGISALLKDR